MLPMTPFELGGLFVFFVIVFVLVKVADHFGVDIFKSDEDDPPDDWFPPL